MEQNEKPLFVIDPNPVVDWPVIVRLPAKPVDQRLAKLGMLDEEVEKVMRGLAVSKFADRDSQEVQVYLETLQNVFDSFQTLPFTLPDGRESLTHSNPRHFLQVTSERSSVYLICQRTLRQTETT